MRETEVAETLQPEGEPHRKSQRSRGRQARPSLTPGLLRPSSSGCPHKCSRADGQERLPLFNWRSNVGGRGDPCRVGSEGSAGGETGQGPHTHATGTHSAARSDQPRVRKQNHSSTRRAQVTPMAEWAPAWAVQGTAARLHVGLGPASSFAWPPHLGRGFRAPCGEPSAADQRCGGAGRRAALWLSQRQRRQVPARCPADKRGRSRRHAPQRGGRCQPASQRCHPTPSTVSPDFPAKRTSHTPGQGPRLLHAGVTEVAAGHRLPAGLANCSLSSHPPRGGGGRAMGRAPLTPQPGPAPSPAGTSFPGHRFSSCGLSRLDCPA